MNAVMLYRGLNEAEAAEFSGLKPDLVYYSGQVQPSRSLDGVNQQLFELEPQRKKQVAKRLFNHVQAFGDLEIDGKPFSHHLAYGKSSDWFSHRFRLYFEMRALAFMVEEIEVLAKGVDKLTVYHSDPQLTQFEGLPSNVVMRLAGSQSLKPATRGTAAYAIMFLYRALEGYFQLRRSRSKKHIILYRPFQEHDLISLDGKSFKKEDFLLGYMLQEAANEFLLVEEFNAPSASTPFRLRKRHFGQRTQGRFYLNAEHILFRGLLSRQVRRQRKHILTQIRSALKRCSDSATDPYHKAMLRRLQGLDKTRKLLILRKLSYERFFGRRHVLTATGTDENNAFTKPALDAFKELGVKTIGIQHGMIHDQHPAYNFTRKDIELQPMPDVTICWGNEWKRLLIEEGNYKDESLVVCGQQRTDVIPALHGLRKSEVLAGLDDTRPLLVFASQPQADANNRMRAARDLFEASKAFPDLQVVVKPHPREYDSIDFYNGIAQEAGADQVQVANKVDLYRLIAVCDMLATCFSTVGAEALYFGKPVIVVDHLGQDSLGFVKREVAFPAASAQEIETAITRILGGDTPQSEKVAQYVSDFAFRIDGKARFRYLDAILGSSLKQPG